MKEHRCLVHPGKVVSLKQFNPAETFSFKTENAAKEKLQGDIKKLSSLQNVLYAQGTSALLVVFQGMDTSGKDSMIKHVMQGINPQGCEVHSFKAPSPAELGHDYLWRHGVALPMRGKIGIFNRSYYEEVLVTRVHPEILDHQRLPFKPTKLIWEERYEHINNFEKYLSENGVFVLKIFLYISKEEQRTRLLSRLEDQEKEWKFSVNDLNERRSWDKYVRAYEKMFSHTSTAHTPWYIVPANKKWSARVVVADLIIEKLKSLQLHYPKIDKQDREKDLALLKKELSR